MDTEGAEDETLLSAPAALLAQFRIMVIEFHFLHELFSQSFFNVASRTFQKLLLTHSVVHHPNNCCGSMKTDGLGRPRIAEFTVSATTTTRLRSARSRTRCFRIRSTVTNTRKDMLEAAPCWYR